MWQPWKRRSGREATHDRGHAVGLPGAREGLVDLAGPEFPAADRGTGEVRDTEVRDTIVFVGPGASNQTFGGRATVRGSFISHPTPERSLSSNW